MPSSRIKKASQSLQVLRGERQLEERFAYCVSAVAFIKLFPNEWLPVVIY